MENVNALYDVLCGQTGVYKDLLEISKNKTSVIVEGKVKELENITKVEQALIFKLRDLEDKLERVADSVKNDLSIKDDDITISVILKELKGETKKKIESQTEEMIDIIKKLDHVNKLNFKLIKDSLDYIDFSINLYSNAMSDANGSYEQSGEIKNNKASFFDIKT